MTKPSASTLARRAQAAKNPKEAKRLRAQAAKMRREARKPRPAAKIIKGLRQALEHAQGIDPVTFTTTNDQHKGWIRRAASVDSMPLTQANAEQPGHGEIVGGRLSLAAEQFASLARKKGGVDEIQRRLDTMESVARFEGAQTANNRLQKVAQESNEQWRKNIVTGFMARMQGLEQMSRNGLPDVVIVDGVTLARVVDALCDAGYSANGKH